MLTDRGTHVWGETQGGNNLLHLAATSGNPDLVEKLIEVMGAHLAATCLQEKNEVGEAKKA